jgi:hypothetical protein
MARLDERLGVAPEYIIELVSIVRLKDIYSKVEAMGFSEILECLTEPNNVTLQRTVVLPMLCSL